MRPSQQVPLPVELCSQGGLRGWLASGKAAWGRASGAAERRRRAFAGGSRLGAAGGLHSWQLEEWVPGSQGGFWTEATGSRNPTSGLHTCPVQWLRGCPPDWGFPGRTWVWNVGRDSRPHEALPAN